MRGHSVEAERTMRKKRKRLTSIYIFLIENVIETNHLIHTDFKHVQGINDFCTCTTEKP